MGSELATRPVEPATQVNPALTAPPTLPVRRPASRVPVMPPPQPLGVRELLGFSGDQPTGFSAILRPAAVPAPVAPAYNPNPANLRAAFDAIPGGGPARTRQLSGNTESWASTWDMLSRARTSVDATYFIVERDIFGYAFLGNMLRHQRNGVRTRLMTDATADFNGKNGFTMHAALTFPPQEGGKDYLEEMAAAGSQVRIYHRHIDRLLRIPDAAILGTSGIAATNHDKILVVDNVIGKTGGRNIARDYFADPRDLPAAWSDGDAEVRGPVQARDLTTAFEREFNSRVASPVTPDVVGNWSRRDIELLGAYHLMDAWMNEAPLSESEGTALRNDPQRRSAMAARMVERALAGVRADGITREPSSRERESLTRMANELAGYTHTRGSARTYDREAHFFNAEVKIVDQTSVASGRYNEIAPALTTLFRGAQRRIVIQNPYVVLTEEEIAELERASSRGVEIWFGTNSPMSTDSTVTQAFFLEDWPYILARVPNARFFVATGQQKFHGKRAVIDDDISIVASWNADWLSAYVNSEVGEITWSRGRNAHLMEQFMRDYREPSNGVLEYTIRRNPDGSAVLVNRGTEQEPNWQPVVEFGPQHHLTPQMLAEYARRRADWNRRRSYLAQLQPLRRPPLRNPANPAVPRPATPN